MNTIIRNIHAIYEYITDRAKWNNVGPRTNHTLAYQVSGAYDHTVNGNVLPVNENTILFIHKDDSYAVTRREIGRSYCISFYAETDLRTMVMDAKDDPRLLKLFKKIMQNANLMPDANKYLAASVIYEILAIIDQKKTPTYFPGPMRDRLHIVHEYILEHYLEKEFDIRILESLCGVGQKHLGNLFRERYGCTPKQYVINLRMMTAANLLSDNNLSISAISTLVGYDDIYYFSRLFKKHFNLSPLQYRKQN